MNRLSERAWLDFQGRIITLGGAVIEPEWLGNHAPHECVCRYGHVCFPHPAVVRQRGTMCPTCTGRKRKVAWQEFKDRVAKLGGTVIEPEWLGSKIGHRIQCPLGHLRAVRPNNLQRGQGLCAICSWNRSNTEWREFRKRMSL